MLWKKHERKEFLTKMELLDLSDFFVTKQQAIDFSARLSSISDMLYESNFNLENALQKHLGTIKKDKFLSLLRENKVAIGSNTAIKSFLDKIANNISNLPTATLTLAVEPDKEALQEISDWFPLNLKKQVLIEIQVEPRLVAGAIISYKGKLIDASIRSMFFDTKPAKPDVQQKPTANIKSQNTVSK